MTLDVVGTLIDFEAGIISYVRSVVEDGRSDRELLGAFGKAEGEQQSETPDMPFTQMLAPIYRRMRMPDSGGEAQGLRQSILDWPAFLDSEEALRRLGKRYRLVAMTNADNWALAAMVRALGEPFDDTVTCEDVGVNKPNPQVFAYCLGQQSVQGFEKADILHVAQRQYHDIGVAKRLEYATCWIERRAGSTGYGATPEPEVVTVPDWHFTSLGELADTVELESGG